MLCLRSETAYVNSSFQGLNLMWALLVVPPKGFCFILGEYVPPILGVLTLARFLEHCKRPFLIPWPVLLEKSSENKMPSMRDARNLGHYGQRVIAIASLAVSVLGLSILTIMTYNLPSNVVTQPFQRQLLVLSFMGVYVFGTVAGLSPSRLTRIPSSETPRNMATQDVVDRGRSPARLSGHHPTCGKFSSHILRLGRGVYCAGCTGLVAGALISLAGCLAYLLVGFDNGDTFFKLGMIFTLFGLLQRSVLDFNNAVLHCLLNVAFVVGTFFVLIGIIGINDNPSVGLYFLLFALYLVANRIILSDLSHRKICASCPNQCTVAFI